VRRQETLMSLFLSSMKKGAGAEAVIATRALGLQALTLGSGDEGERCVRGAGSVWNH
jgi:Interferon-related developmental regulator (IFRD)